MLRIEELAQATIASWCTSGLAECVTELGLHLHELRCDRIAFSQEIERARAIYAQPSDNDIEIDDEPLVAPTSGGVWIAAWLWVPEDAAAQGGDARG
ncbi:hypothetical protein [Acidovorax sp. SUPP3334]|uniref:hypothetical protein n=1 Tax=Acidovorax sp. SUPP3334 TaxID=2920881 RepID=UPI0023DE551C|nr:hypothetical protein [Acidovorax sp. SUPP3334]GKT25111.1 hypothetical protein AVHM3334_16910 [Acidovorax sp. SUPP3334]